MKPRHPLMRVPVRSANNEDSMTKQSFKDECDIHRIVNRYAETGIIPVTNSVEPQYGDAPTMSAHEAACMAAEAASALEAGLPQPSEAIEPPTASQAVSEDSAPESDPVSASAEAPSAPGERSA